jgi:carbon-monoxide dehydrogenase medium subunit
MVEIEGARPVVAKMTLPHFDLETPESVGAAAALLRQAGAEGRALAGGTDLLVKMKRGLLAPRLLVSLRRIAGFDGCVRRDDATVALGPRCTMNALAALDELPMAWAALREGAAAVGGPVIRNRATVGGNIVNARPCADAVPPLMALGARIRLERVDGARLVELDGFFIGPGETAIGPDELLTSIELGPACSRAGSSYLKITRRAAMEVTIAGCAAYVELDQQRRTVARARLVLSSVAPIPWRAREVEQEIEGQPLDAERLRAAGAAARRSVRPIDDHRATAAYRAAVVEVITRRALAAALERAMRSP